MSVLRTAYKGMLLLYPMEFRRRFAPELLETFDSMVAEYGAARLLLDMACSLQRQWWIAGTQRPQRPALVLGSIIQGEYPSCDMDRPDAARMLQGAIVCALVTVAAVCLNQVRTEWSLMRVGVTRIELPYTYTDNELVRRASFRPGKRLHAVRHRAGWVDRGR